jgi:hypothetical protein
MSIKSIGISEKEQVSYTRTKRRPVIAGPDSYVAGGDTEELNFTGPWSAMVKRFNGLDGSLTKRLEATLTRSADGNFGELRYTFTTFIPAEEATQGDPGGTMPGTTRESPCYELTTSEASAPLLTHPKFSAVNGDGARALTMLMTGHMPDEMFNDEKTIAEVAEGANSEAFALVSKGVTEYLVQRVTLTARYRASSPVTDTGMAIKSPPGPFGAVSGGRDWLYMGATQNLTNGEIWVTETYKLSGPGGWDASLY